MAEIIWPLITRNFTVIILPQRAQMPQRNKLQIYSLELFQCSSVSSVANEYTVAKILNVRYSYKIADFGMSIVES